VKVPDRLADLAGLIGQREHHRRRRAMQRLPMLLPLQGAFERTLVLIRLLLLQVLQQRGGCQVSGDD